MKKTALCFVSVALFVSACGSPPPPGTPSSPHGKLSELSRVEGEIVLCDHQVPAEVCTRHNPELVPMFKRVGDWCSPHEVPESQCHLCHPDLSFEPLPKLDENADIAWLSEAGEDVPDLDAHAVVGKVTVFDFYAEWCAACRKVDGHVYQRLASGDETIAYRKLNIVDWESPLAQRYVKDVPSLPYLIVYGKDGKRRAAIHGSDVKALDRVIADANQ